MPCYKRYNSPEQRAKRSEKSRRAANARWKKYHESLTCEPIRIDLPDDLYRFTFENIITGDKQILLFHPGTRKNNYRIDVNGQAWKTCGFSEALELIGKSCYRISVADQQHPSQYSSYRAFSASLRRTRPRSFLPRAQIHRGRSR